MNTTRTLPIVVILFAVANTSCGGGGDVDEAACEVDRTVYPVGPYGVNEGDVLADLELVNLDGSPYRLSDIHTASSNHLLLVSTAAGWCTACVEEQPMLAQLHDDYSARGLVVLVSYFENAEFEPATIAMAERWKAQYDLPFDVVADSEFVFQTYYDARLTPMNMLVDLDCMQIIRITTGNDPSVVIAIIEATLGR